MLPAWLLLCGCGISFAEGVLERLRDDVRSPSSSSGRSDDDDRRRRDDDYDDDHDSFGGMCLDVAFSVLTSPRVEPQAAEDDDSCNVDDWYFPRFPYDHVPGYMMPDPWLTCDGEPTCPADWWGPGRWPTQPRTWAARLRLEYGDEFDDLSRIGGHLLVSTRARFGLDTQMSYLEEQLAGGRHDELWIGDCNVLFRLGQTEYSQSRIGIGFNWLDDPMATDFGFNFTYGGDLFPCKPWIFSATIDWGTLGRAELFRFRTTGGLIVHRVEVYTGYEYLDIDSMQLNLVLGGVRIWF
jgi:hypothetical protein